VTIWDSSLRSKLRDILRSRPHQFRRLSDMTDELLKAGHFSDTNYYKAQAMVHSVLCDFQNDFCYFRREEANTKPYHVWGLLGWLPKLLEPPFRGVPEEEWVPGPLVPGTAMHFTLVDDAIEKGFFKLRHMRSQQITEIIRDQPIPILCYGAYQIMCWINPTHSIIYGEGLKEWYLENQVDPGDYVILEVFSLPPDKPLVLRIFTEWERAPDRSREPTYQRDISRRGETILVLIWKFLNEKGTAIYIDDIVSHVQSRRPEVKTVSVEACLSNNRAHFCCFGKGMWGLTEWNPNEIDIEKALGTISEDDLVYTTLSHASQPLAINEIARRIAKELFLEAQLLLRTNFMDLNDPRLVMLSDGKWYLADNLQAVVDSLRAKLKNKKEVIENLKTEKAEQATEIGQMKKHLDEGHAERDELFAKVEASGAVEAQLKQQLLAATTTLRSANQREEERLVELEQARSRIRELNQRTSHLEAQISELTLTKLVIQKLASAWSRVKHIIWR